MKYLKVQLGFDRWFDEDAALWVVLVLLSLSWRVLSAICFKLFTRPS